MPAIGQFVLHSMANPPLKAGEYTLAGQVDVNKANGEAVGPVQTQQTHLRVTAPRYKLPTPEWAEVRERSGCLVGPLGRCGTQGREFEPAFLDKSRVPLASVSWQVLL